MKLFYVLLYYQKFTYTDGLFITNFTTINS